MSNVSRGARDPEFAKVHNAIKGIDIDSLSTGWDLANLNHRLKGGEDDQFTTIYPIPYRQAVYALAVVHGYHVQIVPVRDSVTVATFIFNRISKDEKEKTDGES